MAVPKSGRLANVALVALSLFISLILPEMAYRAYLTANDPLPRDRWSWWLLPAANTEFDAQFGQKYTPDSTIDAAIVRDGLVVGCLEDVYKTNVDGLSGATTLADLRPDAFAVDRTYFYAWLWRRLAGVSAPAASPRVTADGFAGDARYRAERQTLRRLGVPIVFVHLPVQPEFAAGRPLVSGAAAGIWTTIERDFDTRIVTYFDLKRRPVLPPVYNLEPLDGHPNADGIDFYGDVVFSAITQRRLINGFASAD